MNIITLSKKPQDSEFQITNEMREEAFQKVLKSFNSNRIAENEPLTNQLKAATDAISNRTFGVKLFDRLLARKQKFEFYPHYSCKRLVGSIGEAGSEPKKHWFKNCGKNLKNFPFQDVEDNKVHIVCEALLPNERAYDFAIWKDTVGYIIEVQTNYGHLKPEEKHRDIIKAQYVVMNTTFKFLEVSSPQVFADGNVSVVDEIIDSLDSDYACKNVDFRKRMPVKQRPFPDF